MPRKKIFSFAYLLKGYPIERVDGQTAFLNLPISGAIPYLLNVRQVSLNYVAPPSFARLQLLKFPVWFAPRLNFKVPVCFRFRPRPSFCASKRPTFGAIHGLPPQSPAHLASSSRSAPSPRGCFSLMFSESFPFFLRSRLGFFLSTFPP